MPVDHDAHADRSDQPGGRSALILGATGLIGGHCLDLLLDDPRYGVVRVLGRRSARQDDPKLEQHVVDFAELSGVQELFAVDDVYCCLGTTIKKAGSQEAFRQVDVGYPITAGRLASQAGAEQFLVVSAVGADADSRVFYNRSKGEMEAAVRQLPFRAIWILRPSLLLGERGDVRVGERLAELLMRPLAPLMLGPLRRYRPIEARSVARAMVRLAGANGSGGVLESEEIARVALPD